MKNTTLLFLIKKNNGTISEICLAMKKRGFGAGRWNGYGGKLNESESIEQALIRETKEESSVDIQGSDLKKVAELAFTFPHRPDFDQLVHVFTTEKWSGDPIESEEMKPEWYTIDEIPFDVMWPDDKFWVPEMVAGKLIKGGFTFGEGDVIIKQELNFVDSFSK